MLPMNVTPEVKLSERLEALLQESSQRAFSIGEMLDSFGNQGFGIFCLFLSMPSALPIPAPGYSTPFGLALCFLGIQMLLAKEIPWVPEKARSIKLNARFVNRMLKGAIGFLKKIECFICPRLSFLCGSKGAVLMGGLIVFMGTLMVFPIPLTNTLPAAVIFLIAIGLIESDGLFCLLAFGIGLVALALYTYVFYILLVYGIEGVLMLKEMIKSYLII